MALFPRLRLVRVKAFPENRYFPEILFSGKENVFMCLVAFQKNFRKIFSNVWLYSWKYHKKHIFYLLLTFSQLPNKHMMSFIPKNSNKTQKDSIFSRWDRDRDRDRSDLDRRDAIAITIGAISWSQSYRSRSRDCDRDRAKRRSARSRSQSRWFWWSRSTPIGAITIVIDVDRRSSGDRWDRDRGASVWIVPFGSVCGSEQWRLDRGSACVRDSCVWERGGKHFKWK